MNENEKLYDAITRIDGAFVDEAAGFEKPGRAPMHMRLLLAAAGLALIAGAAFAVSRIIKKPANGQEAAIPTQTAAATQPTATEPISPTETALPANVPVPDPIVPGTKAYSLKSVVAEWYQSTGNVGLTVFENGRQVFSETITERRALAEVARAFDGYLDTLYIYVSGEDFSAETEDCARRIDLTGGGAALSIWEGTNYVRYVKGDFTRWFLLDGYTGMDHEAEFLFDELMAGSLLQSGMGE